jgi:fructokinase
MTDAAPLFACIEAGGTKFVVGLVAANGEVVETARFPTTSPGETIASVTRWLSDAAARHGSVSAAGIASFGPLSLDRGAGDWGHITATPKPGWAHTDLAGPVSAALGVPVGFDTDVNGAALAEARWGAGQGQRIAVYITIGTGIGGGAVVDGVPLLGLTHPEMGHIRLARHPDDAGFAGICPFHGDCAEGLASGPAIIARWGASLSDLPAEHGGHGIIAYYIAQLAVNLQAVMEPGRIILGGGVMGTPGLLERVRLAAATLGAGYFKGDPAAVIVAPGLGDRAGLLGALALAMDVVQADPRTTS